MSIRDLLSRDHAACDSKYAEAEFNKAGVKTLFYFEWPDQNLWGRGPQIKKLEAASDKKGTYEAMIDELFADPRFQERMISFNGQLK